MVHRYLTYCIPSFSDTMNFRKGRYLNLPTLDPLMTREDRAAARGGDEAMAEIDDAVRAKVAKTLATEMPKSNDGGLMEYVARCAFFDRGLQSGMSLVPTPARLKRAYV
jgi:hypothetical protein